MKAAAAAALVLLLSPGAPAQAPPQDQTPKTTFKSSVDLVPVDVNVVDKDGRPLADLAAADFSLTVDGKPRRIASSEFIAVTRVEQPAPPAGHPSPNPAAPRG